MLLARAVHSARIVRPARALATTSSQLPRKICLSDAFAKIREPWSPRIAGDVNECQAKLARLEGEFVWHHHEEEDELFLVWRGAMRMRFRDGDVDLSEGELIVLPRGVEHCPVALSEACEVVLLERNSTLNTGSAAAALGDAQHERTKEGRTLTKPTLERVGD